MSIYTRTKKFAGLSLVLLLLIGASATAAVTSNGGEGSNTAYASERCPNGPLPPPDYGCPNGDPQPTATPTPIIILP
jgi:hypothetical protein